MSGFSKNQWKARPIPVLLSTIGLVLVLTTFVLIQRRSSSFSDENICLNQLSGVRCSESTKTCKLHNALVDSTKLSTKKRGAIQLQCNIMDEMHFVPSIINMIRQPSQVCGSFDAQLTIIILMDDSLRDDFAANLALMENAIRICRDANIPASQARVIVPLNKFDALWRNLFRVVPPDVQLCLQEAVVVREQDVVPNLAFERQLFLPYGSTMHSQSTRIGMLMAGCQSAGPCQELDPIVAELKARQIPIEPIYLDDVTIRSLYDLSDLAVLISVRSPLDAVAMFLPPTATLIEIAFDDELRTISRYNALVDYQRIRFTNVRQTSIEIARKIHEAVQLSTAIVLPQRVAERRQRPFDPNNPRLAVVVPYRDSSDNLTQGSNRRENLIKFVKYMNDFLIAAGRDFEIVVIEQEPGALFNKAALFNIAYQLLHNDFAYMALHDVDQLPLDVRNDYRLPEQPTHLCTASSQYDWKPAYATMVGGVLLLTMEHYKRINGMSNRYWGWGLEDDDLYFRLVSAFGEVPKLDPSIGRYQAQEHDRVQGLDQTPLFAYNKRYLDYVVENPSVTQDDGINTIQFHVSDVAESELGYTKYTVGLDLDWMPTSLDQVPDVVID